VSPDGRTYTIRLRPGIRWNTTPPRTVTAPDFVRGFKMLCNPVSPTWVLQYFTGTIVGLAGHCAAFAKIPPDTAAIRRFVETHEVSGVRAVDDTTIVVRLNQPATDFLNILATGPSAVP